MNDFNLNNNSQPKFSSTLLVIGIGIILLGCMALLEGIAVVDFGGMRPIHFWPLIIVAVGVAKIIENKFRGLSGWIITIIGLLFFANTIHRGLRLDNLIKPAIVIIVGIFIVLYALKRHRKVPPELQKSDEFARGTAILGAYSHKPREGYFNGGVITAIFGGFDVDLRRTTMKYEAARMDVFILLGGGEIRVPEGWDVTINVSAIGGAVDDKRASLPATDGHRPTLLITGTALFGGIEIK